MKKVVIGAAYGDEGKGRTVNSLATERSLVVRFNGGAQAGHTVCHDGKRHVFSHFGSGSLKGARTHLSRFFVCHPILFYRELGEIQRLGISPVVTRSPRCYVTTPFDVILNQLSKKNREHGTVGVGFGETVERYERGFGVDNPHDLYDTMNEWLPVRCSELDIDPSEPWLQNVWGTAMDFCDIWRLFNMEVPCVNDSEIDSAEDVIFEGAQGLLLDQNCGDFPHVTRSNTGMENVLQLTNDRDLDVYYVTRAYTTRHGNGPLPYERGKPYDCIDDRTNTENEFQGRLRYSYLNLPKMRYAVMRDQRDSSFRCSAINAVVTCMDELPEKAGIINMEGEEIIIGKSDVPYYMRSLMGFRSVQTTQSP